MKKELEHKKKKMADKMKKKYGGEGKGYFDNKGGWHGKNVNKGKSSFNKELEKYGE